MAKRKTNEEEEFTLEDLEAAQAAEEELSEEELLLAAQAAEEEGAGPGIPEEPRLPPDVGPGEAFVNSGANALPGGRPVVDALSTLAMRAARSGLLPGSLGVGGERATLTPQARAELQALGEAPAEAPGIVDEYRRLRDIRRERTEAGREQNPWASGLGTATGIGATVGLSATRLGRLLPQVSVGSGLGGRLASGALTGAAYGALQGLTDGEADLTRGEVGQAAQDTATGGLVGGALGLGAAGAVEAARPLAGALRRLGIQQGKQTIQGSSDIAAATREPLADEAVEQVLRSGAIRPFSTTQATAQRIEDLARESGEEYARIVAELEKMGVRGPDAETVVAELLARGGQLQTRTLNRALPAEFLDRAEQIAQHGESLQRSAGSRRLGLTQAEDMKRSLQEMVRYGKLEETPLNAVRREIASVVRQANEDAVEEAARSAPAGSALRNLADSFVPVKQRTGRLLEAERFAQKGASKAEQRSPVSFKDLVLGATMGEPVTAMAVATGSSIARNRLPSTISSNAYRLSEGLRTGSAAPWLGRAAAFGTEAGTQAAQDYAEATEPGPEMNPITAALIRALRNRRRPGGEEEVR